MVTPMRADFQTTGAMSSLSSGEAAQYEEF